MVQDRKRCGWGAVLAAVTLFATLLLTVPAGPATAAPAGGRTAVVIRHTPAGGAEATALVRRLGGTVGRRLGIIEGFAAEVPAAALSRLRTSGAVHSVTENQPVTLNTIAGFDSKGYSPTTMYWVAQEVTGAGEYWGAG